jgi:hypothetical protein
MPTHEFKNMDYVKESIAFTKSNLIPSVVAGAGMMIPILGATVLINFLRAQKDAKSGGEGLSIGGLFKFDGLVPNFIASLSFILFNCCFVPGALTIFTMPIMADRPGTEPVSAIKGALAFGKQNLVGMIIMTIFCILPVMIPMIGIVIVNIVLSIVLSKILGSLMILVSLAFLAVMLAVFALTLPIYMGAVWNAYNDAKSAVAAAAAEGGITLA